MNKTDLVASIASKANLTKKDSELALNAVMASVQEALKTGEKVTLVGFGSFEVRQRAARKGLNPQTKKEISIPAKNVPVFKAGQALKDSVK